MSKENLTPRERAESLIINAMDTIDQHYRSAINDEKGVLSRLDLIDRYGAVLVVMSTALQTVSTEAP